MDALIGIAKKLRTDPLASLTIDWVEKGPDMMKDMMEIGRGGRSGTSAGDATETIASATNGLPRASKPERTAKDAIRERDIKLG